MQAPGKDKFVLLGIESYKGQTNQPQGLTQEAGGCVVCQE